MANKRMAKKVLDKILHEPESHNQANWVDDGIVYSAEECGTTACVAGWATMLDTSGRYQCTPTEYEAFPGEWYMQLFDTETRRENDWSIAGMNVLELTPVQAVWLFDGNRSREDVLAVLKHMADTGEFAKPE